MMQGAITFNLKKHHHHSTTLSAEDFFQRKAAFYFSSDIDNPPFPLTKGRRIFFFWPGRWILDAAPRT